MSAPRGLIVNADDFGFTTDVNAGIVEAHREGILTAATIMANGAAFDDAVRLAASTPSLDIGCHLVLVQGESVLTPGTPLPRTLEELVRAVALKRIRIYEELVAQVRRALDAGLNLSHLDTHKHTHLLPPVLEAVARISEEFRIRWVRRPFDFASAGAAAPWTKRAVSRCLGLLEGRFEEVLARHGCLATDHFAGFQITGRFGAPGLAALIRRLPPGVTEFMCHPGRCRAELRAAPTRLRESREVELEALLAPRTKQALEEAGVALVNYRDLSI